MKKWKLSNTTKNDAKDRNLQNQWKRQKFAKIKMMKKMETYKKRWALFPASSLGRFSAGQGVQQHSWKDFFMAGGSTTQLRKKLSYISLEFLVPVKINKCINDDLWKVLCLFAIVDDHLAFLIAVQTIQIFATTLLTFAKIIVIIVEQIVICAKC